MEETKAVVTCRVPNAHLEDDSAGALIYQFPLTDSPHIPAFVKYLDADPDGLIKAWGISQTTLEEVFLTIIRYVTRYTHAADFNVYTGGQER
jgi:hypothetical protein